VRNTTAEPGPPCRGGPVAGDPAHRGAGRGGPGGLPKQDRVATASAAMRATRDLIRDQVDNPAFSAADVAFLDVLVARFDELDEDLGSARPRRHRPPPYPLIHGDFNGKNLRVQASPQGLQVGAFDWEDAGWPFPALTSPRRSIQRAISPRARTSPPTGLWSRSGGRTATRPTSSASRPAGPCGARSRDHLGGAPTSRVPGPMRSFPNLRLYNAELTRALDRFGWAPAGRRVPWSRAGPDESPADRLPVSSGPNARAL